IAAVAALTVAIAAPALAQATPRSASTQHRLQQERMRRPARYHSAYHYEYEPAYRYTDDNEDGVIATRLEGTRLAHRRIRGRTIMAVWPRSGLPRGRAQSGRKAFMSRRVRTDPAPADKPDAAGSSPQLIVRRDWDDPRASTLCPQGPCRRRRKTGRD